MRRLTALRRGIRLPLRVRLTLAFAGATAVLLAAAGTLIFLQVKAGLDSSLDASLRARAAQFARLAEGPSDAPLRRAFAVEGEPAQLLDAQGNVLAASPRGRGRPLLQGRRLKRALSGEVGLERREASRLLGRPVSSGRAVVVSTSMVQRERALEALASVLLFGGPLLLLIASSVGYLVAAGALRPVERMRRHAAEISAATSDARLPLPGVGDELHRLGETLNAMLARLEASAAHERSFLTKASHELRTPLAILKAEVDVALHDDASEAELRAALASIGEEADRLVRLAEDLLVIVRGEDGSLPLDPEPVDVGEIAHDVVRRFAVVSDGSVRCDIPPGLVIEADRMRLEQALGNLLENALRHGSPPITLSAVRSADAVEVHITDAGAGFDPDQLRDAFERITAGHAGGFGLGLTIVASIARAHGGNAAAANTGHGADVWLALPSRESRA